MKAAQQGGNLRFKGIPREGPVLNKSVIDTLYYCCLYHYDEGEVRSRATGRICFFLFGQDA